LDTSFAISTLAPHTIKSDPDENGLNIFLFLVTINQGYLNYDLPRRDTRGRIISNPLVGLDLHYLLTPYSIDNNEILTQQILGSTIRILHEKSVLTRQIIAHEFDIIEAADPLNNIVNSGLEKQNESIKLVNKPLSIEDLTKLWSSYFQTNYRLSVAYVASPVIIESKKEAIHSLPVQERKIFVRQFRSPIIEQIEPFVIQWDQNINKRIIHIIGKNLVSNNLKVEIGESQIPSDHLTIISDEKITVNLPNDLPAGIKRVKIIYGISNEDDDIGFNSNHLEYESNTSIFILAPFITTDFPLQIVKGTIFDLDFKPPLKENQKIEVVIGEKIFSQAFAKDQIFPTETMKIDSKDFPVTKSLFRLRINGADSFLESGPDKKFIGPEIDVRES
jgi:hypothetical protein